MAAEMAAAYGVPDRMELVAGDMFADALPVGVRADRLQGLEVHDRRHRRHEQVSSASAASSKPSPARAHSKVDFRLIG